MRRYNKWAGNPNGIPENKGLCIAEVAEGGRSPLFHQCFRKRRYGPNGEYCKQHAKQIESGQHVYVPKEK